MKRKNTKAKILRCLGSMYMINDVINMRMQNRVTHTHNKTQLYIYMYDVRI